MEKLGWNYVICTFWNKTMPKLHFVAKNLFCNILIITYIIKGISVSDMVKNEENSYFFREITDMLKFGTPKEDLSNLNKPRFTTAMPFD